ncbi:MAG: hypothetical protein NTV11_18005 [Rhodocyclales bacterium]|nr:hypothetical protein [Rhodocyclales bacterium]
MRVAATIICLSITFGAYAGEYDDCVLTGLKGVSSDAGAKLVAQACKNKINEVRQSRRSNFGTDLAAGEYAFNPTDSVQRHDDGLVSQTLVNKTSQKTITYVALTVGDGVKPAAIEKGKVFDVDDYIRTAKPASVFYYKVAIRPGKSIRLKFPLPKSGAFYTEVTTVLGRESKWADAAQQFKEDVSPEPKDRLE